MTLTTNHVADGGRVGEGVEDEFLGDLGRVWQFFDIHHVGKRGRGGARLQVLGRYCAATAEDCVCTLRKEFRLSSCGKSTWGLKDDDVSLRCGQRPFLAVVLGWCFSANGFAWGRGRGAEGLRGASRYGHSCAAACRSRSRSLLAIPSTGAQGPGPRLLGNHVGTWKVFIYQVQHFPCLARNLEWKL